MNIEKYLERIGYKGGLSVSKDTLFALHSAHLFQVPFENLDIFHDKPIPYDVDFFYEKVVVQKRGGFCYELNGLFEWLLRELGFTTTFVSARLANTDGSFGPEYDHMALLAEVGGEKYLCDVGFGDSFITPLPIGKDISCEQFGKTYAIREIQNDVLLLSHTLKEGKPNPIYSFTLRSCNWDDFQEMFMLHQTLPGSKFRQKRICSKPTPAGRITIGNLKLIVTQNIHRTIVQLKSEEEFFENLRRYFNIQFSLVGN